MDQTTRHGVLAAGNFITDYVKIIDTWPEQDMLANIASESMSNGGGPYNVLRDLAATGAPFPLEAAGLLGDDANGQWIRDDCRQHGIDTSQLRSTGAAATSYTDAMCVESDGRRTFFHQRGANARFSQQHVDLESSNAKILLLAYLLLLDTLDELDEKGRTEASRLLERARAMGYVTAVETVSATDSTFRDVVVASLRHADLFFANEVEAGLILGKPFDAGSASLQEAAADIAALEAPGRIIIHSARGAVCREPDGTIAIQPALALPSDFIKGSTGAGDGFTTGVLYGFHEGTDIATCLLQGVCVAAQTLTHPTPSQGVRPLTDCLDLATRFGYQNF